MAKYAKKINNVTVVGGGGGGGGGITALTGDVTASGTGSVIATLATVNSNIGTFNNVTVNAKGLVTSASNVPYLTAEVDTLQTVTGRGATSNIAIALTNATVSTSTTTGALVVTGGVGIQGKINGNNAQFLGSVIADGGGFIYLGGTSSQFLKADGSRDSNTYLTSLTGSWLTGGNTGVGNVIGTTDSNTFDAIVRSLPVVRFNGVASAVNYAQLTNSIAGANPKIEAVGSDGNIGIDVIVKGAGKFNVGFVGIAGSTISSPNQLNFTSSTATSFVINNNAFSVATGNGGSVSFSGNHIATSGDLNIFSLSAGKGNNSGITNALRIFGTLGSVSAGSSYRGIHFDPTTTTHTQEIIFLSSALNNTNSNRYFIKHTGLALSDFGGNINLTGSAKITTYAGITTVSMGVAPIINDFSVTARTTAYTTQSLFTASATGLYELVITVEYASGSSLWVTGFQINYTNAGVATTHVIEPNYFATQTSKTYVASIRCDSGTAVTFSTTLAGATTHNIDILTKRLR
jgi:hypothetical protein